MRKFLSILICLVALGASAQKEKVEVDYDKKAGIVTVNESPVFKVIEEKSSAFPGMRDYTIESLDGKKLMILIYNSYKDYHEVSQYNKDGSVSYYEVAFLNENKDKAEIRYNLFKSIMKLIYTNDLIKDGKLDKEAVDVFVMKNGSKFSELRDRR